MRKRSFCRLLGYEFRIGRKVMAVRYVVCLAMIFFVIELLVFNAHQSGQHLRFWNMYVELWEGVPEYVRRETSQFRLPVLIMFTQTFLLFLIGSYPKQDIQGYGKHEFLHSSRRRWWLSKCVWVFVHIFLYYAVLMALLALIVLVQERNPAALSFEISDAFQAAGVGRAAFVWNVVLLPIIASEVIGILQTFTGVFLKPVFGYMIAETVLVASAYKMTPLLFGNYMMLLRNRFYVPEAGLGLSDGLAVCCGLYAVFLAVGCVLIKKGDILSRENEPD